MLVCSVPSTISCSTPNNEKLAFQAEPELESDKPLIKPSRTKLALGKDKKRKELSQVRFGL
jgi:hypothetical protein